MNFIIYRKPCLQCSSVSRMLFQARVLGWHCRVARVKSIPFRAMQQKVLSISRRPYISNTHTHRKSVTSDVLRLLRQAKPERLKLSLAVLLLFVSSSVMIAFPFCIGKVIDIIYTSSDGDDLRRNLRRICKVLATVVVIGGFANFGRVYLMNTSAQRIINALRRQAHASILRQEIAFFDKTRTGDLLARLSSDTSLVGLCLTQNMSDGLRSTIAVVGGVTMMVYTSLQLSLVGLSIVPPVAIVLAIFARKLRGVAADVQTGLARSSATAEEQFSNIRTVRSFANEGREIVRYATDLSHLLEVVKKETVLRAVFFGSTGATGNLIVLSVLYYGGILMTEGQITVGNLSAFLLYAAYVGVSIGGLGGFVVETAKAVGASRRVWEIVDRHPKVPSSGGKTLPVIEGNIEFSALSFAYPTRLEATVLDNLNLTVPAGKVTAVVGPSGQGKSTLAALLLRLYDPTRGKITLDGVDIRELDPNFLRINIGVVSQEPVLFSASVYENILYGAVDPSKVSREEVAAAAKEANAWDFIESFPDGLDTLVGERGVLLSGGQKQRVAIARVMMRNPKVLILDEATSSLDSVSERAVQGALRKLMKGRTVLTIAHRLSTIKQADRIAVLKGGKIGELGTYQELLAVPNGLFRTLVEHQTPLGS